MSSPPVYVGCVNFNSMNDLEPCLTSVRQQTYPNIQMYCLDNASHDGSSDWLISQSDIKAYISPINLGYAQGHNFLINQCKPHHGTFYLALNPDVILDTKYIAHLVDYVSSKPQIGWCIGKLMMLENPEYIYSVGHLVNRDGYAINIGYGLRDQGQYQVTKAVFGASGATALYRGEFIDDIKYKAEFFDSRFFLYGEDTDVDWRGQLKGWHCWYIPSATALHRGGTASPRHASLAISNRYLSVVKNAFLIDLILFNIPQIVVHLIIRLIITPRRGVIIASHFMFHVVGSVGRRCAPKVRRTYMIHWFRSNCESRLPQSIWQRIKAFSRHRVEW